MPGSSTKFEAKDGMTIDEYVEATFNDWFKGTGYPAKHYVPLKEKHRKWVENTWNSLPPFYKI